MKYNITPICYITVTSFSLRLILKKIVPKELLLPTNLNNSLPLKTQALGKDKPLRRRMNCAPGALLSSFLAWTGLEKGSKEERKVAHFDSVKHEGNACILTTLFVRIPKVKVKVLATQFSSVQSLSRVQLFVTP